MEFIFTITRFACSIPFINWWLTSQPFSYWHCCQLTAPGSYTILFVILLILIEHRKEREREKKAIQRCLESKMEKFHWHSTVFIQFEIDRNLFIEMNLMKCQQIRKLCCQCDNKLEHIDRPLFDLIKEYKRGLLFICTHHKWLTARRAE